ncbi:MAG: UDP-N-acetylmuramate--L-alanine ligase [Candidatus Shapirobacteria bacterium]|nr:UDP-N-acetylmuramate--L-alanine ligase [Candidatus Shapirobacteria bacterium]
MIGIKGAGMTALAACLKDKNIKISGSDLPEKFITDQTLAKMNLTWWENFSADHITNQDLVIATGSNVHRGPDNIEAKTALKKGIAYLTHGEALGVLMAEKQGISVCGVGGKTTTSALLATLMDRTGLKPSFAVGAGEIFPLGLPGRFENRGKFFIAEADEYATAKGFDNRPRFFWQNPQIIICTNIEHDHPDIYPNLAATKKAFRQFFQKLPQQGWLIINGDNKNNQDTIQNLNKPIITYGEKETNSCQIKKIQSSPKKTVFSLQYNKQNWGSFVLKIPGRHNIFNATAAIIVLKKLGIPLEKIKSALTDFKGTKRRFEFLGKTMGKQIWDDYAHHPSQIKASLSAAKDWFGGKSITVIFQPHTFSRTKKLLTKFANSFSKADQVIILPVYSGGRESGNPNTVSQTLAKAISHYHQKVDFVPQIKTIKNLIKKTDQEIIITMGAGDVWKIGQELLKS